MLRDLRFDVKVVGAIARRYQFLVNGEYAAWRIAAKNRGARGNRRDNRRCEANAVECRPGLAGIGVVGLVAHEKVLRWPIVVNAAADAYDQLAVAHQIVGQAQARRKVSPVLRIERRWPACRAYRFKSAGLYVEDAECFILRADHTVVVPAQAVIERDPAAQAPGVQQIGSAAVLVGVARTVAIG